MFGTYEGLLGRLLGSSAPEQALFGGPQVYSDPCGCNLDARSFSGGPFRFIRSRFGLSLGPEWTQAVSTSSPERHRRPPEPEIFKHSHFPAVWKDAFYFDLGCPLPGEGPNGHLPSKIDSFGPVLVRFRGSIFLFFILTSRKAGSEPYILPV